MKRFASPWKMGLFVVLSLTDLVLTFWLLKTRGGLVYESNPVANWILKTFAWPGLVVFKLGCIAVFVAAVGAVAKLGHRSANRLLVFGCVALVATLVWSAKLALATEGPARPDDFRVERRHPMPPFPMDGTQPFPPDHPHWVGAPLPPEPPPFGPPMGPIDLPPGPECFPIPHPCDPVNWFPPEWHPLIHEILFPPRPFPSRPFPSGGEREHFRRGLIDAGPTESAPSL